jgi:hypothetical protein
MDQPKRRLPPVTELAVASMILVVAGGIYVAAYLPATPPLVLPSVLLALSAALLLTNVAALSRVREFAWRRFFQVGRWALLAYIVTAGMLELVFILDQTPGTMILLLTCMLAIYAIDIPLLLAFSVARYDPVL